MFHSRDMEAPLQAPLSVKFDYTRSLGPVLSAFFTGIREGYFVGARTSAGVMVPPPEFDPTTLEPITEFVELPGSGVVQSWSWVSVPVAGQPFSHPFAFALITLDGADTPLLHAVDAGSPDLMHTGMRVEARWASERVGDIREVWFEPAGSFTGYPVKLALPLRNFAWEAQVFHGKSTTEPAPTDQVTGLITPVHLDYTYAASPEESKFFRGLKQGRIIGQRCPSCHNVYVPPRGACPECGVPTTDEVELPDRGTITTFCIVNVPFMGQRITPPYVSAYVLLDGADIPFLHLVLDIDPAEIRMGMRVKAVWRPEEKWGTSMENISHFAPTGEPDADFESYRSHL